MAVGLHGQTLSIVPDSTVLKPGGGQVTFTVTVTYPPGANSISGVMIGNGGTGYTSAPAVAFKGGGGSGAAGTAVVSGGVVKSITMTSPGSGYSRTPVVVLTGGGGTGATAFAKAVLPGAIGINIKLPANWTGLESQNIPPGASAAASPLPGDLDLGWAFWAFPVGKLQFTFVASYPPGVTSGIVSVNPTQSLYRPGAVSLAAPNIVFGIPHAAASGSGPLPTPVPPPVPSSPKVLTALRLEPPGRPARIDPMKRCALFLSLLLSAHAADTDFRAWAPTPPMGWNSWDGFATTITESQTKAEADVMASKLKAHGWEYVVVDIQWYEPAATGFDYRKDAVLVMDEWGPPAAGREQVPVRAGRRGASRGSRTTSTPLGSSSAST